MRPPPAVGIVCGDGGAWRLARLGLLAVTAATLVAWVAGWLRPGAPPWQPALAAALAAAFAFGLGRSLVVDRPAGLRWDGQVWRLLPAADQGHSEGEPGTVDVVLDLGGWMLLRFQPAGGGPRSWWPVGAAAAAAGRPALYARRAPAQP